MTEALDQRALPVAGRLSRRARWVLEAASDAFERLLGDDEYARCPEHGVDHTGKTARAVVINCALNAAGAGDEYLTRALRIGRLITGRLGQDAAAGDAWIFYPGRHNPANVSNNIIDNGECVDALATLLRCGSERLGESDRIRFEGAIRRCCDTYLVPNVVSKPVINQRLWGAMGLASAYAVFAEPAWALAVERSVARSLDEMRADGSFPYITDPTAAGEHDGLGDLTVHYHSRCLAFAQFALRQIDRLDAHAPALRRGADFLQAVLRPDGVKPLLLDGKRWFWDADHEVGSAPYDAYALAADGREDLRDLAGRVASRSAQAMAPDGMIEATPDAPAFVCRVFHTADLAWLARAHAAAELDDLPANPAIAARGPPREWPDAGVVRIQSVRACAIVRTRKRPASGLVGGRIGGGTLAYVGRQANAWRNELTFVPEPAAPEATWTVDFDPEDSGRPRLPDPRDRDTRFRLHVARMHARAGRRRYAAAMLWRFLGPPAWAAEREWRSSGAIEADVELTDDAVIVRSFLARLDGSPLEAVRTARSYRIDSDRIRVDDRLICDAPLGEASYRLPAAAEDLEVQGHSRWRCERGTIVIGPIGRGSSVAVRYRL